ncbi:MAG: hypothetical protein E6J90_12750 [Deltaproteobacteria bacterium]|nr:MAG: hypothetical protein E6J91_32965 [Deltaproteobacteria bacterium]TMQ22242.1 MAG: hypothetical protein E6J90_12750 [Deltaproteobacteria bacterium]
MRGAKLLLVGLAACGSVKGTQTIDAAPADTAVPDTTAGPCNLAAGFANPAPVPGAANVSGATVSYDELVIYFSLSQGQSITTSRAARKTKSGAFPVGEPAPGVPDLVLAPSANEAETVLYLQSGQGELLRMTRANPTADWANFTDISIAGVDPFISRTALYFSAGGDIKAAPLQSGTLGSPVRIDSLATAMSERNPVASADDLEIAFNRDTSLVVASRTSTTADFNLGATVDVGTLASVHPAGISEDRCRLYVTAQVGNSAPLYMLSRP